MKKTVAAIAVCGMLISMVTGVGAGQQTAGQQAQPAPAEQVQQAAAQQAPEEQAQQVKEMTMQQAQQMAADNSRQAVLDDMAIKIKELELETLRKGQNPSPLISTRSSIINNDIKLQLNERIALMNLENSRIAKENNSRALRAGVYKNVADTLLLKSELNAEKQRLELLKQRFAAMKTLADEGKVLQADLFDMQYSIDSKQVAIARVENRITAKELELKKLLNLPMDGDIPAIQAELRFEDIGQLNLDEVIAHALEASAAIRQKTEDIAIRQEIVKLIERYYKQGDVTYDDFTLSLEGLTADLQDAKLKIELDIRNKYNDLLTQKDKVDMAVKYEELVKQKLEALSMKLQLGLVSRSELLSLEEKLIDARYQRLAAVQGYMLLKADFINLCG